MNALSRAIGFGLLTSLAARLPGRVGVAIQVALVLVGSVLPVWPVTRGWVHLQDILAYGSLWMGLSVVTTVIRMLTLRLRTDETRFFTLHYVGMVGILTLVTTVWSIVLLVTAGPSGGWTVLWLSACGLVLSAAWSLADGWFVRGGCQVAQPWQVLLPGYLRWLPMLVGTIVGAVMLLGDSTPQGRLVAAVALVLAFAVIDITLALVSLRGGGVPRTTPAEDTGAPEQPGVGLGRGPGRRR